MDDHFTARLPRKRMAAGALFVDGDGRLLIVKPTYRPEWLVPGGVVEDGESPHTACEREIEEELGVPLAPQRLLCVEYRSASGAWTESLHFIFYGGVLTPEQIARIAPRTDEIADHRFASRQEAMALLDPPLARRIALAFTALEQRRAVYAEDGLEWPLPTDAA